MRIARESLLLFLLFMLTACALFGVNLNARQEFDQGLALFNRGAYERAIPHFERATDFDPDFARAFLYLGRSHLNLGQWLEAVHPLRTAYRLSPSETRKEAVDILVDALLGAAIHEFKQGNFQTSVSFLKEVLDLDPQSERAKNELIGTLMAFGGSLLSEGRAEQAIEVYREALDLSPENLQVYLGLARAFFQNGDLREALQTVGRAIRIDPANEDAQELFRKLLSR